MDIGNYLKENRLKKNMTQQELADKLGVTDRAISNWENNKRLPDYTLINSLCNELDLNIEDLFLKEDEIIEKYYKEKISKVVLILNAVLFVLALAIVLNTHFVYYILLCSILLIYLYCLCEYKSIKKYTRTIGTITSVKKLYFIKINKKFFRTSLYKDSYFPLLIKIKYVAYNKEYIKKKIIFKNIKLTKDMKIFIIYNKNNPNIMKLL